MTFRELLNELNDIASKDESLLDIPLTVSASGASSYTGNLVYDGYHVFNNPRSKQGKEIRLWFDV